MYAIFKKNRNNSETHVQSQTHVLELDLGLTKIHFSTRNKKCRSACKKPNSCLSVWLEFDYKSKSQLKIKTTNTNDPSTMYKVTVIFELDLSLTKIQYSISEPSHEHMYNIKLQFFSLTSVWLNSKSSTKPEWSTRAKSNLNSRIWLEFD